MISETSPAGEYEIGQEVEIIVKTMTDLGYKVIVDGKYWGVLYYNEVFQELEEGQVILAFIKQVRPDGKLDLTLYKTGLQDRNEIGELILNELKRNNGFLKINAKTPAEEIYEIFGVSKKKFKIALGGLYKQRKVIIEDSGIRLL